MLHTAKWCNEACKTCTICSSDGLERKKNCLFHCHSNYGIKLLQFFFQIYVFNIHVKNDWTSF